jgi:porphobilinogen synthase
MSTIDRRILRRNEPTSHANAPEARIGRLRGKERTRTLLRETRVSPEQLIQPLFVVEEERDAGPIESMPGVRRHAQCELDGIADTLRAAGVRSVMLFGVPAEKDELGGAASAHDGPVARAARHLRAAWPDVALIADVCLCQYTSHGQCGVLRAGRFDRAATLRRYAECSVTYAEAAVDLVAPSGMVDGMVGAIRRSLDERGFDDVGILSYAVKFASAMYGPFREAAGSSFKNGHRRGHQLDPANRREAIREALQDLREGADILMVKPAMANADVIAELRTRCHVPIAAYQVSGEYAMIGPRRSAVGSIAKR